jgi:ribosomal protein L15
MGLSECGAGKAGGTGKAGEHRHEPANSILIVNSALTFH